MTESVNIDVYCDAAEDGGIEVFAVVSEHRPDLPKPFDKPIQEWTRENFSHLEKDDSIPEAGELVYEPNGEIIEIRKS